MARANRCQAFPSPFGVVVSVEVANQGSDRTLGCKLHGLPLPGADPAK
jgi:hypothetical protein